MALSYRNIHSPVLVRISYRPRVPGGCWSSISLDPAMARLAETFWGARWKQEVRQLAILFSGDDPWHTKHQPCGPGPYRRSGHRASGWI